VNTPRNTHQISNLPFTQRVGHGGKNRAIPAGRFYRGFYSSRGVMGDSRQVTLTNLIAGPLGIMPVAETIAKSQMKVTYPLAQGKVCGRGYQK